MQLLFLQTRQCYEVKHFWGPTIFSLSNGKLWQRVAEEIMRIWARGYVVGTVGWKDDLAKIVSGMHLQRTRLRYSLLGKWCSRWVPYASTRPLFISRNSLALKDIHNLIQVLWARKWLGKIVHLTEHYQVKAIETLKYLEIFIDSKMYLFPAGDENSQETWKLRVLVKASRSSLWVSLAVKELQKAYSEERAEDILNDLPTNMNEFCAGMLENIFGKVLRTTALANAVFMWALLSLRPLNVNELQLAIKLDINQSTVTSYIH